jgi:hypothetical protein
VRNEDLSPVSSSGGTFFIAAPAALRHAIFFGLYCPKIALA